MNPQDPLTLVRRRLIGHGALLVFAGGLLGFGFLFFLIGRIELWPIPGAIEYQMPGTYDGWRMAHMEGIVNGMLLWLTAALLPLIPLSIKWLKLTAYGLILTGWTFVIASTIDPFFPDSRGLAFGGPLTNTIAFLLFYPGVVTVMVAMAVIAFKSLRSPPSG